LNGLMDQMEEVAALAVADNVAGSCSLDHYLSQPDDTMDARIAAARATLGSLDRVKRIVKVLGMVNSAPGFTDQPKVINGFSDLMVEVFGEAIGKHARSAVGMAELPFNIPVEIEMILEIEQD